MHHFCWSHACSSSETVSRNTVFCRRFLVIFICFCFVVCFLAFFILIPLFTLGNKEMSEAEFQENSDRPKQASPKQARRWNLHAQHRFGSRGRWPGPGFDNVKIMQTCVHEHIIMHANSENEPAPSQACCGLCCQLLLQIWACRSPGAPYVNLHICIMFNIHRPSCRLCAHSSLAVCTYTRRAR